MNGLLQYIENIPPLSVAWSCLRGCKRAAAGSTHRGNGEYVRMKSPESALTLKGAGSVGSHTQANSANRSEHLANDVAHCVDGLNRLREYRNYYVHGLTALWGDNLTPPGPTAGWLVQAQAKGRLRVSDGPVDESQIRLISDAIFEFAEFAASLAQGSKPSQGKPPLPERLEKSLDNLTPLALPPQP